MLQKLRHFFNSDGLAPMLIKAGSGSAGIRVAGMGFAFLVGILLARGLGTEGYGVYGVAMSIIALLTVPTQFGLSELLVREVATAQLQQKWGIVRGILQWTRNISLVISAVILSGVFAWLFITNQGLGSTLGTTILFGMGMVPLVALMSQRSAALRGFQWIVRGQLPDVLLRPAAHSLLLLGAIFLFDALSPAIAIALGVAAVTIALLTSQVMLGRALPAEVHSAQPEKKPQYWLKSAFPMAMTDGMRVLQAHLLIIVLGWLASMNDVGVFRMASSVMLLIGMPITLLNTVSMPIIAKFHASENQDRLRKMLPMVAGGMVAGVSILALPFLFVGEDLLGWLFGEQFTAGNKVLLVLSLTLLTSAFFGPVAALLTMTGHQAMVTKASLISISIFLIVSWPMVSAHGAMGAAISSLMTSIPMNVLMWWYATRSLKVDTSLMSLWKSRLR